MCFFCRYLQIDFLFVNLANKFASSLRLCKVEHFRFPTPLLRLYVNRYGQAYKNSSQTNHD